MNKLWLAISVFGFLVLMSIVFILVAASRIPPGPASIEKEPDMAQDTWMRAINKSAETIQNGSIVRITGAAGNIVIIEKMDTNALDSIMELDTILIASEDIDPGESGYVIVVRPHSSPRQLVGFIGGVDTSDLAVGECLYFSPNNPGGFAIKDANGTFIECTAEVNESTPTYKCPKHGILGPYCVAYIYADSDKQYCSKCTKEYLAEEIRKEDICEITKIEEVNEPKH